MYLSLFSSSFFAPLQTISFPRRILLICFCLLFRGNGGQRCVFSIFINSKHRVGYFSNHSYTNATHYKANYTKKSAWIKFLSVYYLTLKCLVWKCCSSGFPFPFFPSFSSFSVSLNKSNLVFISIENHEYPSLEAGGYFISIFYIQPHCSKIQPISFKFKL